MRNRNRLEATSPWVLGRLAWAMLFCVAALLRAAAGEPAEIERRLGDAVRYLASDQLEGRGVGTKGLDLAAEFIARQFAEAGLKTRWSEGGPFQEFTLNLPRELGRELTSWHIFCTSFVPEWRGRWAGRRELRHEELRR
jgi:hypothetical protein